MSDLVLGLDTFGDVPEDDSGALVSHAEAIRQVVTEATLADELGVDAIALGEHHRPEYAISTPETVLAAIAARTSRIHLPTTRSSATASAPNASACAPDCRRSTAGMSAMLHWSRACYATPNTTHSQRKRAT